MPCPAGVGHAQRWAPEVEARIEEALRLALEAREPLEGLLVIARRLRDAGLSQQDAEALFTEFLSSTPKLTEREDDVVRDALDFITGFCAPHARIFP
jgi:hypothetical protein